MAVKDIQWNAVPLVARLLRVARRMQKDKDVSRVNRVARMWQTRTNQLLAQRPTADTNDKAFLLTCNVLFKALATEDHPGMVKIVATEFLRFLGRVWEGQGFPDFPRKGNPGDAWTADTGDTYVRLPDGFWTQLKAGKNSANSDLANMSKDVGWHASEETVRRVTAIQYRGRSVFAMVADTLNWFQVTDENRARQLARLLDDILNEVWHSLPDNQRIEQRFIAHVGVILATFYCRKCSSADTTARLIQYLYRFMDKPVEEVHVSIKAPLNRQWPDLDFYTTMAQAMNLSRSTVKEATLKACYSGGAKNASTETSQLLTALSEAQSCLAELRDIGFRSRRVEQVYTDLSKLLNERKPL